MEPSIEEEPEDGRDVEDVVATPAAPPLGEEKLNFEDNEWKNLTVDPVGVLRATGVRGMFAKKDDLDLREGVMTGSSISLPPTTGLLFSTLVVPPPLAFISIICLTCSLDKLGVVGVRGVCGGPSSTAGFDEVDDVVVSSCPTPSIIKYLSSTQALSFVRRLKKKHRSEWCKQIRTHTHTFLILKVLLLHIGFIFGIVGIFLARGRDI
jgi:hypothetical protein